MTFFRLVKVRVRVSEPRRTLSQSRAGSESNEVEIWHRHSRIGKDAVLPYVFCCPSLHKLTRYINFTNAIV